MQVVRRQLAGTPQDERLGEVLREVGRLEGRLRGLLEFSAPFEMSLAESDLRAVVEGLGKIITPSAEAVGVTVEGRVPRHGVVRRIDERYLEEALHELCTNALRAMPEGGRLALSVEDDDGTTTLRVADTGRGIPSGLRPQVFDLFFTANAEGNGIGLATVRRVVEAQGGTVRIERSDATGTVFAIRFGPAEGDS